MKINFNKLDLTLYHEKLDNGLDIYIVPKDNVNNIYATFTTKYGGVDTNFKLNGKDVKSPAGIAHFLEHKMFEQENGEDPFKVFDKNGAQANAMTSSYKTTYLFAGPTDFKENINLLLDFVQEPYFTDENVEKEKGIIVQEIKMCEDVPYRIGYNTTLYNSFVKNPIRIPVIGSEESVNSITKEDLYECYRAFYHPNNMFLVITGNVKPKEVIKIIKENQKDKQFKEQTLEKKEIVEPDKVYKKKEVKYMNVTIPKVYYSYKINIKDIDMEKRFIIKYLAIYLDSLYGSVSDFEEEIEKEKICNYGIDFIISKTDSHLLITFIAETRKVNKLIDKIKKYMGHDITLDDFNRKKKVILSSNIFMTDNIFKINNKIVDDVLNEDKVITDIYDENNNLKYDTMVELIKSINFKNTSTVIIKPNKK